MRAKYSRHGKCKLSKTSSAIRDSKLSSSLTDSGTLSKVSSRLQGGLQHLRVCQAPKLTKYISLLIFSPLGCLSVTGIFERSNFSFLKVAVDWALIHIKLHHQPQSPPYRWKFPDMSKEAQKGAKRKQSQRHIFAATVKTDSVIHC